MPTSIAKLLLVRDNEKRHVMYFFLLYAILGCGIAFGRNSTDVLFFKRFGIEYLPLMYVALSIFLALISVLYAAFADRLSPEKLSIAIFGTLICLLAANWAWINYGHGDAAYPAYFLLYEAASEVLIIHSAHYLSQNFDSLQAKRLYPLIMAGTQVGIIIGSIVLAISANYIKIQEVLLAWCLLLGINILMIFIWHKQHGSSTYFRPLHKSNDRLSQAASQIKYGFTLIKTSRMLRAASFALFFMVITFYILCYSVNRIYTQTFTSESDLSSFFGMLTATTNGIALLLQIFVTNRVIHKFGVKKVNLFFPVTSMISYLTLLSSYSLGPAILGSINKDAIMPAFRNPVRTIFFNTLPENVQGRARATSVVIVLPLALFVCGLMLILMQKIGAQNYFLGLGMSTAVLYLFFNHLMNKAYISELLSTLRSKVLMPANKFTGSSSSNKRQFPGNAAGRAGLFNNSASAKLFDILMDSYPEKGYELITVHADQTEASLTEQLLKMLKPVNPHGFTDALWQLYNEQQDPQLKSCILKILFELRDPRANDLIPQLLQCAELQLRSAAIIGALLTGIQGYRRNALDLWQKLVESDNLCEQVASLDLLEYSYIASSSHPALIPAYKNIVVNILDKGDTKQLNDVLSALQYWPEDQFCGLSSYLLTVYDRSNANIRLLCVKCCRLIYKSDLSLLHKAIEDNNPLVRQEAARIHFEMAGDDAKDIFFMWLATGVNGTPVAQNAYLGLLHEISTDNSQFEQIAMIKAELAQDFYIGLQVLAKNSDNQTAAFLLVKHILQERMKQYIELSVYAIQGFEKDEDTRLLSICINSRDSRHIANACEVLRNFKHQRLGQILSDLVDQRPVKFTNIREPKFSDTVKSVLLWCKNQPDAWLSNCAREALKSLA